MLQAVVTAAIGTAEPELGGTSEFMVEKKLSEDDAVEPAAEEQQAIAVFRALLAPLGVSESAAQRFLRAKSGDAHSAVAMYRRHLDWRAAKAVDDELIYGDSLLPAEQEAYLAATFSPSLLDATDAEGRPVLLFAPHDIDEAVLTGLGLTRAHLTQRYIRAMERTLARLEASPSPLTGYVCILDASHLTLRALLLRDLSTWIEIGWTLEQNYPSTLGAMMVLGSGEAFEWAWASVRHLVDTSVAAKLQVCAWWALSTHTDMHARTHRYSMCAAAYARREIGARREVAAAVSHMLSHPWSPPRPATAAGASDHGGGGPGRAVTIKAARAGGLIPCCSRRGGAESVRRYRRREHRKHWQHSR